MIVTILVFLILISLLVLIHEFGHFWVAKKFGIKVEEFGFGFPPKALSIKKGETEYSINWLPIGGFVKMYGEDEAGAGRIDLSQKHLKAKDKDADRAYFSKTAWQRAGVVVAGVVMNALLAIVIFYAFLSLSGFKVELPLITKHTFIGASQNNETFVSIVSKDSPVEKAGMKAPAKILSVDGISMQSSDEIRNYINSHKGTKIALTWQDISISNNKLNFGKIHTGTLVPRKNPPANQGAIGVGFSEVAILEYKTPAQKIFSGIIHPINLMSYNFDIMGTLIQASLKEKSVAPVSEGVSGPVGIYSLVGNILDLPSFKEKVIQILNLAGILSISLAFFNVLPIPALDGGRLFFILIEAVSGKKVNQKFENMAHTIGMAVLLTLVALVTLHDIFGKLLKP